MLDRPFTPQEQEAAYEAMMQEAGDTLVLEAHRDVRAVVRDGQGATISTEALDHLVAQTRLWLGTRMIRFRASRWPLHSALEQHPGVVVNVRTVVAGDDVDPRLVGLLLHPTRDLIIGAMPGTPALELGPDEASELTGYPLASRGQRLELMRFHPMPSPDDPVPVADGGTRTDVLRRMQ